MKHLLTWHGPVQDVDYEIEADTEEDAMNDLCVALNENDEEWLDGHRAEELE